MMAFGGMGRGWGGGGGFAGRVGWRVVGVLKCAECNKEALVVTNKIQGDAGNLSIDHLTWQCPDASCKKANELRIAVAN